MVARDGIGTPTVVEKHVTYCSFVSPDPLDCPDQQFSGTNQAQIRVAVEFTLSVGNKNDAGGRWAEVNLYGTAAFEHHALRGHAEGALELSALLGQRLRVTPDIGPFYRHVTNRSGYLRGHQ